jgi:uncharacterized Zn finger protein (UPF0148 family)
MNNAIIYDDADDERSWCNSPCNALLYERKDGSMICSYCGREYLPGSVKKHKRDLQPSESVNDSGPEIVPMTSYGSYAKQKKPSVFDREDRLFESKSGRHFTDHEDWP